MLGGELNMPIDIKLGMDELREEELEPQNYIDRLQQKLEKVYRFARENINKFQTRQKRDYDVMLFGLAPKCIGNQATRALVTTLHTSHFVLESDSPYLCVQDGGESHPGLVLAVSSGSFKITRQIISVGTAVNY